MRSFVETLLCVLLLPSFLYCQSPYLIAVGATRSDIRARLGTPEAIYSHIFRQSYSLSMESFLLNAGDEISDIYERDGQNSFRLTISYAPDGSASRLHPVDRVVSVRFIADKQQPYRLLLMQIPEVTALCTSGCDVEAEILAGSALVFACRQPKSIEELQIMQAAAADWGALSDAHYRWCATVYFTGSYQAPRKKEPAIEWETLPVDYIVLGPALLPSESGLRFEFGDYMQYLGSDRF